MTVPDRKQQVRTRVRNSYSEASAGQLRAKGPFDVYTYPGTRLLGYTRKGCTMPDTRPFFFVHVYPMDRQQLPAWRRQYGFDKLDFRFFSDRGRGKLEAGQCWATVDLPAYAIARIRTGQYTDRGRLWETDLG